MSNELTKTNDYSALPTSMISAADMKRISAPTAYLRRIQLYTKGRAIDTGLISPGHYGVPNADDVQDLGKEVDVMVFALRPKAMDVSDLENIRTTYSLEDPLYNEIVEQGEGALFGPSFLVFERSTGDFFEMFFCNKSARKIASQLFPFLPTQEHGPLAATLGVRYAKNAKGGWFVTTVKECTVPFQTTPELQDAIEQVEKFLNPVEEEEEDTRKRSR